MFVRLVLWSLSESKANLAELRRPLRDEIVQPRAPVAGLRLRAWVSDEGTERWGAIELWDSRQAAARADVLGRVRDVIGKDPALGEEFDVEAVEGALDAELSRRGLAFDA
jgi:hypothetical protein